MADFTPTEQEISNTIDPLENTFVLMDASNSAYKATITSGGALLVTGSSGTFQVLDNSAASLGSDLGCIVVGYDGTNYQFINVDSNGKLQVVASGTVAATQSGTWDIGTLTSITNVVHVDDNGGSLTVDNGGTFAVQAAQSGTWNIGTLTSITNVIHVDDNGGSITVDNGGTFAVQAAQSGAWSVSVSNFPSTYDISDRAARLLGVVYGSQGQQLKQTATNFNLQVELATGSTLYDARQIRALTSADVVDISDRTARDLGRVRVWDLTNFMPTMDVASRAGFQKITDGTNTMPTMDVASRAGFFKRTDGTNTAPTMDAVGRAGFQKVTDGTNVAEVTTTTEKRLKVETFPSPSAGGEQNVILCDATNPTTRKAKVDTSGRLQVSTEPPGTPPSTTGVVQIADSIVSSNTTVDQYYTVTNGKVLTIQRFNAGGAQASGGHIVELFEDPNGNTPTPPTVGTGWNLISVAFIPDSGGNYTEDLSPIGYAGNGTRRIVLRRTRLSGAVRVFAKFTGFEA